MTQATITLIFKDKSIEPETIADLYDNRDELRMIISDLIAKSLGTEKEIINVKFVQLRKVG